MPVALPDLALRLSVWHLGEEAVRQIASDPPESDPTFPWSFDGEGDEAKIGRVVDLMTKGLYVKAATIRLPRMPLPEALGFAYMATKSIQAPWYSGNGRSSGAVIEPSGWSNRNTSIGDVIMDPCNRVHACCSTGWRDAGPAPEIMLDLDTALGVEVARAQKPASAGMSL